MQAIAIVSTVMCSAMWRGTKDSKEKLSMCICNYHRYCIIVNSSTPGKSNMAGRLEVNTLDGGNAFLSA